MRSRRWHFVVRFETMDCSLVKGLVADLGPILSATRRRRNCWKPRHNFSQALFANRAAARARNFQEKKEAYIGFLEALHRSDVEQTREASMRAGHWKNRCDLVASPSVRAVIEKIFETNPDASGNVHPDRPKVIGDLRRRAFGLGC